jgi:hypothetical protein
MRGYEVHTAKLVDIPLVRRLAEKGTVLDSELCYTREPGGQQSVSITGMLLPQRGQYTLVGRADKQHVIGQFRLKPDDHLAQIVYVAPMLEPQMCDTAWLVLMDAMASEAGRRGAHILTAEVDEGSPLFISMRQSGFAVYARQEIWWRPLSDEPLPEIRLSGVLAEETDDDQMDIQLLYSNIVPRLVQAITVPSRDSKGLVYRKANRVQGYIAVSEGKAGVYIMPYLHPDVLGYEAAGIIAGVIAQCSRADRMPVYVCVRRYQDWLADSLSRLGFEALAQQAMMVRHIAAGIRQTNFTPLVQKTLEAVPNASPISKTKLRNQEKPST